MRVHVLRNADRHGPYIWQIYHREEFEGWTM